MTWNKNIVNEPSSEGWGGPWTEKKLNAFSKYVWSYLTILKKYPQWKTIYFDGFAGSGSKESDEKTDLYQQLKISEDEERTYKGAAERILNLKDGLSFDYYYFIDKNQSSLSKLKEKLEGLNLTEGKSISYRPGDANKWIKEMARALHTDKFAALVLLDPFGMQIDWSSIEELRNTRSDVWILIPTGVIVNRLLDRKGELKNIQKLESFFGLPESKIKEHFYRKEIKQTLFGDEEESISKVYKPIEKIAALYSQRLNEIWKYVTEEPLKLKNSTGATIFHFVFASNNPSAVRIAKDIIKPI
ncbi:three-Cys-motif partner protein TcmP [Aquiflexum sp. TKW24L]|uniref:three-Cys-motif partner protein TcmP n=1 Tax=Aquiflexum sp. TKW24L TaxID=2942212 RepID=UPI0020BFB6B3|nr:three-Cys-motif partner protein TcmP [Aquiflexum sp. TKW24L]MCL6261469.1 three-Cys-motif partner protein TcmP [Aquiflexum sp. TKW24L]